jgi:hypothetical protein
MSNQIEDDDEIEQLGNEAEKHKQKLRDALIEFAVSQGMVGDDYDGELGKAGSRDQDAPYPKPLQEEFGAETPREHHEKDAQALGVELPDDASGEEKAEALMQAEMLGKTDEL